MIRVSPSGSEAQVVSIVFIVAFIMCAPLTIALDESTGPKGCNVQPVWTSGPGYTGQGVSVGLISLDHALITHEAFYDKDAEGFPIGNSHAHYYDSTGQNNYSPVNHDTSVAGMICSRGGTLYPEYKGIAPDAELYSANIDYPENSLNHLLDQQCKVIVTAVELGDGPTDGSSFWSLMYDYYAYTHNLVFATASGNSGTIITAFGDTYNGITTGGLLIDSDNVYYKVGSVSNSGPTTDGRRKPDVTAPSSYQWSPQAGTNTSWGENLSYVSGQTSWAVPQTGGVAAVLLSYANTTSDTDDNQNVVIKAVIVNSAFPNILDISGSSTVDQLESEPGWPWNTDRGYGRIDAFRSYHILSSPKILPSTPTTNMKGWSYDAVSPAQQDNYTILGRKNERLLVTLTWNRRIQWNDQAGGPGHDIIQDGELVPYLANLDLEIHDPDGFLISPAASAIDNLEKVDLLLPKTGNYEIKVTNQSGSESANYALAFELLPSLEGDFNVDYVVNEQDMRAFIPYWLDADCLNSAQPCFDYNLALDDSINLLDFWVFADRWLDFEPRYYTP